MALIAPATAEDIPVLLPLIAAYWQFEALDGFDERRVAEQLQWLLSHSELGIALVARGERDAVGYLLGVLVFSLEHFGLTAEIDELFVLPSQRGRGVGGELLSRAESEFARLGCTNVSLQLARGNDPARAFYRRQGYVARSSYELLDKTLHGR